MSEFVSDITIYGLMYITQCVRSRAETHVPNARTGCAERRFCVMSTKLARATALLLVRSISENAGLRGYILRGLRGYIYILFQGTRVRAWRCITENIFIVSSHFYVCEKGYSVRFSLKGFNCSALHSKPSKSTNRLMGDETSKPVGKLCGQALS